MTLHGMLRILADDLTGALDAAAPFASADPVRLLLNGTAEGVGRLTLSTESRGLTETQAIAEVRAGVARISPGTGSGTLWFKKVDSVLRGHTLAETLAMARAGGFGTCIFAPAFPAMGRITRGGCQLVRDTAGDWQPLPPGDLRAAIQAMIPQHAPGLRVKVLDAESQAGLVQAVAPWRGRTDILWAGSRGLAEALVAEVPPLQRPTIGLFILGTSHPATRAQATALAGQVHGAGGGRVQPSAATPLLLDPVPMCRSGAETRAALQAALQGLVPPEDGSAIFVTGGDCQSVVLQAVEAEAADCLGEIAPGLPMARIIGGRMDGTLMISKSGGFGEPDLLREMIGGR